MKNNLLRLISPVLLMVTLSVQAQGPFIEDPLLENAPTKEDVGFSVSVEDNDIQVNNPWLRAAPPRAPALAVFMTLKNDNDQAIALTEVKGDIGLGTIELHRTTFENGVMTMTPQEFIPIAPHSSTVLKPGSWHIMLLKPLRVPKVGETIQLILMFNNGSEQQISMPVIRGKKMMKHNNNKMMSHQ